MLKLALAATLLAATSVVAWNQRFEIKSLASDATWDGRAKHRGSGSETRSGMRVEWYDVNSGLLNRKLGQVAFLPSGETEGRAVVFFLHGRAGHPGGYKKEAARAFRKLGDDAPVIVHVAGGDHSYYHDRDDGPWGSYVTEEAIPAAIKRYKLDGERVAIGGISMGGFGALDIARQHPRDFCAVGGHSAALWSSAGETPSGAFDDAEDFEAHDVIEWAQSDARQLAGARVWLDTGEDDPFRAANADLASALEAGGAKVTTHTWPGGHGGGYWNRHFEQYVGFYADALRECRSS